MTFTRLHSLLSHLVFVGFVILIFHYYVSLVFVYIKQHFLFNRFTIICSFKFTSTATYQTLHFSYLVDRSFILIFNGSFILITFRTYSFSSFLPHICYIRFPYLQCHIILTFNQSSSLIFLPGICWNHYPDLQWSCYPDLHPLETAFSYQTLPPSSVASSLHTQLQ